MFFAFSCEFIYLFIFQPGGCLLEFIVKVDLQATVSLSLKNLGMSLFHLHFWIVLLDMYFLVDFFLNLSILNISSHFLASSIVVMKLLILLRVLYGESLFSCYVEKLFVPWQFEYDVSRYGSV